MALPLGFVAFGLAGRGSELIRPPVRGASGDELVNVKPGARAFELPVPGDKGDKGFSFSVPADKDVIEGCLERGLDPGRPVRGLTTSETTDARRSG